MIDTDTETLIEFADAAKRLPRTSKGKPVNTRTVARWAMHGVGGVKLDSVRVGGRRLTSLEAIQRFMHELTNASTPQLGQAPDRKTPENVRARLAEKGLLEG